MTFHKKDNNEKNENSNSKDKENTITTNTNTMHPTKNIYVAATPTATPTSPFASKHHPSVAPSPTSSPHPSVSTTPVSITIQPMLGDPFEMPVMLDIDTVETLKESITTKLNLEEEDDDDDNNMGMDDVEEEQRKSTTTTTTMTTPHARTHSSTYKLVCAGKVLEYGTLRENGLRAGSRVAIAPRLQSGKDTVAGMRLAQARAQRSVENIKTKVLEQIASMLPEHLDKPITLSIPVGKNGQGGTVNVTIEPNNDHDDAAAAQASPHATPMKEDVEITKLFKQLNTSSSTTTSSTSKTTSTPSRKSFNNDDEDEDNNSTTNNEETRRALMQRLANRAQDQAAIARVKSVENKRTSSKIEDLREKMKAKRAHLDRVTRASKHPASTAAATTPTTTLPSVGALPAVAKTGFGGFKKGFLFASTSKKSV